ncbi:hypothetical protein BDDG_01045 [Blastomyces dermatitidis ATCC 18188]|uniref:Uncharacterized protein n=1 Tax=Ajellomyces dermatitidis (strain ATCC 18188 / CBS 674.68) TaxID=653446 RepID=F2T3V6_AJEDA|nr:hypothetical protein BDDG_01045 [Blastomyces dermatitidis ATCC 18188]
MAPRVLNECKSPSTYSIAPRSLSDWSSHLFKSKVFLFFASSGLVELYEKLCAVQMMRKVQQRWQCVCKGRESGGSSSA